MSDLLTILPRTPKLIGIAADHGGYELKEYLVRMLRGAGHEVIDCGDRQPTLDDDYPDSVVPPARAVACGEVERGVAICGSGVGASVVANKVAGVRACLIHETFSAHQGVEDDDLNMICLGGLVAVTHSLGNWFKHFSPRDSAARSVIVAVWPKLRTWKTSDDQKVMKTSPLAGKPVEPGMLVNVSRLITATTPRLPTPRC